MKSFDEQFDDSVRGAFDNYQEAVDPTALARLRGSLDAAGLSAHELGGNAKSSAASGGLVDAGAQKPNSAGPQRGSGLSRRIMYLAAGFLLAASVLVVLGYYGFNRMWESEDAVVMTSDSVPSDGNGVTGEGISPFDTSDLRSVDVSDSVGASRVGDITDGTSRVASARSVVGASSTKAATSIKTTAPISDTSAETTAASTTATSSITGIISPPTKSEQPVARQDNFVIPDSTNKVASRYQLSTQDSLANQTRAHIQPIEDTIEAPIPLGPLRSALPSTQPADPAISTNGSNVESSEKPGQSTQLSRASVVLGSNFNHTTDGLSDGIGLSFGALRQWQLVPKVRLVTGGLLAWNQFSLVNSEMAQQVDRLSSTAGSLNASIETETRYTTIALEIPVQGMLEVYRGGGRSLSVGAGLSSMVYLSETTVREGVQYQGEVLAGPGGEYLVNSTVRSFENREEFAAFDRIDAGRLLNLSVLYEIGGVRRPVMVELFTKQPLGTLTSSDVSFGMTGITIRYGIW